MKYFTSILALLISWATISAQYLYIPPQHRVTRPAGACMWLCVETLTGTHGYTVLSGRAAYQHRVGRGGATQYTVRPVLNAVGVPYRFSPPDSYDWRALRNHARTGAIVGVQTYNKLGKPTRDAQGRIVGHSVVVLSVNNGYPTRGRTYFWDPSAPTVRGSVSTRHFSRDWYGNSLTIVPRPR